MEQNKRWGKDRKYTCDWQEYNDELVRRGTFFFQIDFLKREQRELKQMNKNKVGKPYSFSNSFIEFQARLHSWLDYRGVEGLTKAIAEYIPEMATDDYSTICRRVNSLNMDLALPNAKNIFAAYDSTGFKVSNRGEWMRQKWGIRRGWIKAHIVVDVKTKNLLHIEVTTEKDGCDGDILQKQLDIINTKNIDKLAADGALDRRDVYNLLKEKNIEPVIKPRKNASTKSRGSPSRAQEVREFKKKGYEKWAKDKEYGLRWATEGKFSTIKRKFGETIRATNKENMLHEAKMKFLTYESMRVYAKAQTSQRIMQQSTKICSVA